MKRRVDLEEGIPIDIDLSSLFWSFSRLDSCRRNKSAGIGRSGCFPIKQKPNGPAGPFGLSVQGAMQLLYREKKLFARVARGPGCSPVCAAYNTLIDEHLYFYPSIHLAALPRVVGLRFM